MESDPTIESCNQCQTTCKSKNIAHGVQQFTCPNCNHHFEGEIIVDDHEFANDPRYNA